MKNILFMICALAIFTAGFVSDANADMVNVNCAHHVSDEIHADHDCAGHQNQDQTDQDECKDCCCIHSHSLAGINTGVKVELIPNNLLVLGDYASLRSRDLSSLYRPPIA